MSLSLPADPPRSRSLTGVVEQSIAALSGASEWFAPAQSAIVFLVDGLGAHNLADAALVNARFLGSVAGARTSPARSSLDHPPRR